MKSLVFVYSLFMSLVSVLIEGRVGIPDASSPLYVEYGGNLTLTCVSNNRRQLKWYAETPASGWVTQLIDPGAAGGKVITRYLVEEPSGYVESTLIKMDISLDDGGAYECRDDPYENNFALWATVLYVANEDVVSVPNEATDLFCSITGFTTNIPSIEHRWYFKEQEIERSSARYDLVNKVAVSQLTINNPVREDGGDYTCTFTLQTDQKPVTFEGVVSVDASNLLSSSGASKWCSATEANAFILLIHIAIHWLCH